MYNRVLAICVVYKLQLRIYMRMVKVLVVCYIPNNGSFAWTFQLPLILTPLVVAILLVLSLTFQVAPKDRAFERRVFHNDIVELYLP